MVKLLKKCVTCGYIGSEKSTTKGSIWIEIVLWIFFIVPGVIYSIWRLTTRTKGCPKCRSVMISPEWDEQ